MNNILKFQSGAIPAPATGREPHTPVDSFAARPSCTECQGEGVVWLDRDPNPRAPWGTIECDHCHGDGYEPAPEPEDTQ